MGANNGHILEVKADPTTGLDDGKQIASLMRKEHAKAIEAAFLGAADLGVSFDLEMVEVQDVLDELGKQIKGVAETTKERVREIIGGGTASGASPADIRKELEGLAEVESRTRATAIARTELARGHSLGSLLAFELSGVVSSVEWLLGNDPCDTCQSLGGKVVKINEEFADGIIAPPAHANCTCAISPVVD